MAAGKCRTPPLLTSAKPPCVRARVRSIWVPYGLALGAHHHISGLTGSQSEALQTDWHVCSRLMPKHTLAASQAYTLERHHRLADDVLQRVNAPHGVVGGGCGNGGRAPQAAE